MDYNITPKRLDINNSFSELSHLEKLAEIQYNVNNEYKFNEF